MLVDVSGSMSSYADSLLRLAHRWSVGRTNVEVFTIGTRLTRVTRAMRQRDPERALIAAGDVVPDWSGGTRLGESLKAFLDRWGQRGMARGAVVVIFSDGWERGDVDAARRADAAPALGSPTGWSGSTRIVARPGTSRSSRASSPPSRTATTSSLVTRWRTFDALAGVVEHA